MTKFETLVKQVNEGSIQTPSVTFEGKAVNFFKYQLSVHHFYLKLMAKGIGNKQIKLKDLKDYYGLKGRTASDVLIQFEALRERILG
jgi:hypothetical protein